MLRASMAVMLSLAIGLAAGPADAQHTETIRIGAGATATDAFVAYPVAKSAAAVIVIHDWWGLTDPTRLLARRLAGEGYLAIAPDLNHGRTFDDADEGQGTDLFVPTDRANADLDATVAWLRANPKVGNRPIGVMGFGTGGAAALGFGLHGSALSGIVVFDGPPVTDPTQFELLRTPVLAHFGTKGQNVPEGQVAAFRQGLTQTGRNAEVYTYPGAGHGFMNDARPTYQPDAARQAWARTLAFLQKQLRDSK